MEKHYEPVDLAVEVDPPEEEEEPEEEALQESTKRPPCEIA